jgi:NAD(P)H-flavin reductase
MARILKKKSLNPTVTLMEVGAPLVAKKAEPGQFIILRATEDGERIPLTIADFDREQGTVSIIFQIVGATTERLGHLEAGDDIPDFVGPLGKPTECTAKKVAIVGGKTKFACVDGPDFDGHEVDFAEAMSRGDLYRPFELEAHRAVCELFKKEAV